MVTAERPQAVAPVPDAEPWATAPAAFPLRLQLPADWDVSDEHFLRFCSLNEGWRFETDAEGGLLIMAPTGSLSGARGSQITSQIVIWSNANDAGITFDPGSTFMLPNGDRREPDSAWISNERLSSIDRYDESVWRVCPDFVVEVRSRTDALEDQQTKMELWISQGARLGWLVDPFEETVWLYRPEREPEVLQRPSTVTASEIADDLTINFSRVWLLRNPESETS